MPSRTSTNGFVLAGGQSRRMGTDKATLNWGETSLLDHMVQLLSTVAEPVRIVGRGDFPDNIGGKGPLGGILTALQATDRDLNLFLAVDLPLLTPDFLKMFHSRFRASDKPALACRIDDGFPLCLGIHRRLMNEVARRISRDQLAIRAFIEEAGAEVIDETELGTLGFGAAMFANVNTPGDWKRLTGRP